MAWINVAKPNTSSWMNLQSYLPTFDEPTLTFDSLTFFDGVNQSSWTKINKPSTSTWTNIAKPT